MGVMFFFFKQKTAYELRISDWSLDVCSSDLAIIGLSPGKTGIEEQVMTHLLLNADADQRIGPRQRHGANSRDIAAESIQGNCRARQDRIGHRRCELEAGIRLEGAILRIEAEDANVQCPAKLGARIKRTDEHTTE